MARVPLLLCLLGVVLCAKIPDFNAPTESEEDQNYVELLTSDNFTESIGSGVWFVKFMSPQCGFCKSRYQDWNALARYVQRKQEKKDPDFLGFHVAQIDVRTVQQIASKLAVGKLPQMILFREGEFFSFPNSRDSFTPRKYATYALEEYRQVEEEQQRQAEEERARQAAIEAASDVVNLNVDEFEDDVTVGNWLIEFYGPSCGYCQRLAPTWEDLGHEVKARKLDFKVAKYNGQQGRGAAKYFLAFKGNPWPSIKLVRGGVVYSLPEPRTTLSVQGYIDWALEGYKATGPQPEQPDFLEPVRSKAQSLGGSGDATTSPRTWNQDDQEATDNRKSSQKQEL